VVATGNGRLIHILQHLVAYRVFSTFAGIGFAAYPVHGDPSWASRDSAPKDIPPVQKRLAISVTGY